MPTPLPGGHSGAEIYLSDTAPIRLNAHPPYIIKLFPPDFTADHLARIPEICRVYQSLDIPALRCLGSGLDPDTQRPFCVYNYISGQNLEIVGEQSFSYSDNHQAGIKVGSYLRHLAASNLSPHLALPTVDLDGLLDYIEKLLQELLLDSTSDLETAFGVENLRQFAPRLELGHQLLSVLEPHLIHGDIKRSNIMVSDAGELIIIDLEGMKYSHDILNFRHQMTWALFTKPNKKSHFLRGFFDGLYNNTRPPHFNSQVVYIFLFNLIEYSHKHRHSPEQFAAYLERMQPLVPMILSASDSKEPLT